MRMSARDVIARLHPLMDHMLALEPGERAAWLAGLKDRDPELAGRLEVLLARDGGEATDTLFGDDISDALSPVAVVIPLAGRRIGAYTLERPLGQGGMGTVWLARRSDGRFEGRAAIKLLNLALLDPVGAERFRREGTLLARLTHPNIARLIDAGVTDDGQPFLVLEHVEGRRIDAYCDEERLGPTRRLELFLQVLGAVAHAHANLIVHRDLKPSNILVTEDRTVKLLDFGIAKLLEADTGAAERSALTDLGGMALTPEYAAPEQVMGSPVTTATDVYALGVLLYLVLAGRHPTGEGCRSAAEHLRAVTDAEPLRLSVAVAPRGAGASAALARVAAARGSTPDRLRRLYAGDLDNIVAKALRKKPAERYATVEAFAEDLRRYLRHEPVAARADSIRYRMGKFMRRNRTAVALGAVAAVALLAGVVGTASEAYLATRQRDRANRAATAAQDERDFALRALSRAQTVNELDHFLLLDAAPSGKPFTVGEFLERAADLVNRERAESDASRAEMLIEIGQDYYLIDQDAKARELLERAYALSQPLRDQSVRARAACWLAAALSRGGEHARAEHLIREALTELSAGQRFAFERIDCLQMGATVADNAGGTEGVPRAEAALALYRSMRFPPPVWEPGILATLGEAYTAAGRFREAAIVEEKASQRLAAMGRGDTHNAADMYNNLGQSLSKLGQPVRAEPLFRKSLQISRMQRSGEPVLFTSLARTLSELGRLDDAASMAERADREARRAGDEDVVNIALLVRAGVYAKQRRLGQAEAMLAEAEPRLARALPPGHYAFAVTVDLHALIAQARGDLPRALDLIDRALSMLETNDAARQQTGGYIPVVLQHRADVERALGRLPDAEGDAERAIELYKKQSDPSVPNAGIGRAYLSLGQTLRAEGRAGDAQRAFASALEQLEPTLGEGHTATREARALARATPAIH
jgi:serine/threonine protein kinase